MLFPSYTHLIIFHFPSVLISIYLPSTLQIHRHTHTCTQQDISAPNHNRIPSKTPASFFSGGSSSTASPMCLWQAPTSSHMTPHLLSQLVGLQVVHWMKVSQPEFLRISYKEQKIGITLSLRCREKQANKAERDSPLHLCCRPAISLPLLLSGHSPFPFMLWKRPNIFTIQSFS